MEGWGLQSQGVRRRKFSAMPASTTLVPHAGLFLGCTSETCCVAPLLDPAPG